MRTSFIILSGIDAASRRLAAIKGISAEEQYKETAHSALMKLFHKGK